MRGSRGQVKPDIVFPHIYREYTTQNLIVMEFLDGFKPSDPRVQERYSEDDRDRLIDLGAAAIIRMLYRDGFLHADLHPGNLIILPGPRADVKAFRRNVEDVCRRWQRSANFSEFSIGRLILESVSRGVVHRMYFPVEMVLMVKAIVTFEGVGNYLKPGFDVATVSRSHINRLFLSQFSPLRVAREGLRGAPELYTHSQGLRDRSPDLPGMRRHDADPRLPPQTGRHPQYPRPQRLSPSSSWTCPYPTVPLCPAPSAPTRR